MALRDRGASGCHRRDPEPRECPAHRATALPRVDPRDRRVARCPPASVPPLAPPESRSTRRGVDAAAPPPRRGTAARLAAAGEIRTDAPDSRDFVAFTIRILTGTPSSRDK